MRFLSFFSNWYFSRKALPYWALLSFDSIIVLFSGYLAKFIELGTKIFIQEFWTISQILLIVLVLFILSFRIFHTYYGVVRYSSFVDLKRIALACLLGSSLTCVVSYATIEILSISFISIFFSWGACLILFGFTTTLMFIIRIIVKSLFDTSRMNNQVVKVSIYGVKEGGLALANMIRNQDPQQYLLDGFITPDGDMIGNTLMGVKVHKVHPGMGAEMKSAGIQALLVSPIQVDKFRNEETLVNELIENDIKILRVPRPEEWNGKGELRDHQLQEVDIEDLLPRDKIEVDLNAIGALLSGKRILITGAAGSIGSELVRQVALFKPAEMVLIDQATTVQRNFPRHDLR